MTAAEVGLKTEGRLSRCLGRFVSFLIAHKSVTRAKTVNVTHLHPALSILRIDLEGPFKILHRLCRIFPRLPLAEMAAEQHQPVSLRICSPALCGARHLGCYLCAEIRVRTFACQPGTELFDDGVGDVVLYGEEVVHRPVV